MTDIKIAIVGLGYVGLPLAVEFGKKFQTVGFDINESRVNDLIKAKDFTLEVSTQEINASSGLQFTTDINEINSCNIFIITVPTPIDHNKAPDLMPLINASQTIGSILKVDDIIIYESTVYPGATEEVCVPILEKYSGLKFNQDFYCGYSPERINPGDKEHRLSSIKKITSGSTKDTADKVDLLYQSIINAGTHKAESIKIAEAAKVIENTQRDINIALINELSMIFNRLGIDTEEVLEAAGTKWNFLPFKPGLVGGHCIGVDPYYLTHKAIEVGYYPEVILAGRKLNDNMGEYIVSQVTKLMTTREINLVGANILIMGLTFKENCPDLRNTKVVDLIKGFEDSKCNIDVYDPWVSKNQAFHEYNIKTISYPVKNKYEAIVLAVAHEEFKKLPLEEINSFGKNRFILYDVKYLLNRSEVDGRL